MRLVHTGHKSGLRRRTPINFTVVDGDIQCTAAFGEVAHWYRNIQTDPNLEVWLPDSWHAGVAEEILADDPYRDKLMRQVLIASGFAAPHFAGLDPRTANDAELAEAAASYRLIRICRTGARTGPYGPGDLVWVWPMTTLTLLALSFLRIRCCQRGRCQP